MKTGWVIRVIEVFGKTALPQNNAKWTPMKAEVEFHSINCDARSQERSNESRTPFCHSVFFGKTLLKIHIHE